MQLGDKLRRQLEGTVSGDLFAAAAAHCLGRVGDDHTAHRVASVLAAEDADVVDAADAGDRLAALGVGGDGVLRLADEERCGRGRLIGFDRFHDDALEDFAGEGVVLDLVDGDEGKRRLVVCAGDFRVGLGVAALVRVGDEPVDAESADAGEVEFQRALGELVGLVHVRGGEEVFDGLVHF